MKRSLFAHSRALLPALIMLLPLLPLRALFTLLLPLLNPLSDYIDAVQPSPKVFLDDFERRSKLRIECLARWTSFDHNLHTTEIASSIREGDSKGERERVPYLEQRSNEEIEIFP